jgi:hypothetical protein
MQLKKKKFSKKHLLSFTLGKSSPKKRVKNVKKAVALAKDTSNCDTTVVKSTVLICKSYASTCKARGQWF